jgi:hypothetical protein
MCGAACPCSRPMTRAGVVKSHDAKLKVIGVMIQMIGLRFIDIHQKETPIIGSVVLTRAKSDGTWELSG